MPKKILSAADLAKRKKTHGKSLPVKLRPPLAVKKAVMKKLWTLETQVMHSRKSKEPVNIRMMKALVDHLTGMSLRDAALHYRFTEQTLREYKMKFFRVDPSITQYLEELFFDASLESIGIWQDKKHEMSATQAAMTSGIFADKFISLKKARATDFKPDDSLPLKQLHLIEKILMAGQQAQELRGKTIDDHIEVARLQDTPTGEIVPEK